HRRKEAKPPPLGDELRDAAWLHAVVGKRVGTGHDPSGCSACSPPEPHVLAELLAVAGSEPALEPAERVEQLAPHKHVRALEQWREPDHPECPVEWPKRLVGLGACFAERE